MNVVGDTSLGDKLIPISPSRNLRTRPRALDTTSVRWPSHILVSTNGSASSAAAAAVARSLAQRSEASIETLGVYSPRVPVPGPMFSPLARELDADLLVIGLGPREPADRPSYAVARSASLPNYLGIPVLAVAAGAELMTRCVVAFPDGHVRNRAVRAALACMPLGAQLLIALPQRTRSGVNPTEDAVEDDITPLTDDAAGVRLESGVHRLDMTSDAPAAVLDLAHRVGATLIAVIQERAAVADQARRQTLAESLLLSARCSVLIVPDPHSD